MRILIIACLLAILPLRGWVSDAMALSQLTSPSHDTSLRAPCPDHSSSAIPDDNQTHMADNHEAPSTHNHASCEVCHGPAMLVSSTPVLSPVVPVSPVVTRAVRFVSSEAARRIKPPIA